MKSLSLSLIVSLFACLASCSTNNETKHDHLHPQIEFAKRQIKEAKLSRGLSEPSLFNYLIDTVNYKSEEYEIKVSEGRVSIVGGDYNGLMYGGLELAEQIDLYGEVKDFKGSPFLKKRGIKFNIPLDARTPSYDDSGDAAQKNIVEMWNWDFWEEFLDNMAIHRYNALTLWNPHPFPSMIKMPDYEDVALNDVMVTTLSPVGIENEWGDPQLVTKNVMDNLKVVKKMSIDEKISFWQKVMKRAANRGIDIHFITWNICPNSVATPVDPFYKTYDVRMLEEIPGKYGVTHQMDNPKTRAYYREAVKTFLLTYPNVKGIGVTAGEHMPKGWDNYNREKWLWETYGLGILDAKKQQPNRTIDFIHRVWFSDMEEIMKYWGDYPDSFEVSFKYAKARLYSSPKLPFAKGHVASMKNYGLKSWWNLRNDDIFVYRWGDPDYVRAFLTHFPEDYTAGYHMGSDGYVWGREFISKNSELQGELEIKKHWYNFMLWGRLGYNADLDKEFFVKKLAHRFPTIDAALLYETWKQASKVIPLVNVFHWRDWDHMFAAEGCLTKPKWGGFRDVTHFMDNPTMKGSDILNPRKFVKTVLAGETTDKQTPLNVIDSLQDYSRYIFSQLEVLRSDENTEELSTLIDDMEAMSYLAEYYAAKIQGAVELVYYKEKSDKTHQIQAITHLEKALEHWKNYATISEKNYKSQMLARTFLLDWRSVQERVRQDIAIAKGHGTFVIK
ncbi:MAG: hypothetical protein JXR03_05585 [Cyclobacteriaceae bacterium]